MFQVQLLVVLLGLTLCVLPSHKTMAQEFNESGVVYEASRNKIGLIRYCRDNQLLSPAIADQAVAAVETGLNKLPPGETFDRERGDRAQQAGEDGFWDVGRRRYIASIANLFSTTPTELCQEWAEETLRGQAPRYREVKTITVAPPIQPLPQTKPAPAEPILVDEPPAPASAVVQAAHSVPLPQAKPALAEPILVDEPPAPATAEVKAARSVPLPPLPEKAPPFLPATAELAALPPVLPTRSHLASTGGAAMPEDVTGTTAITPGTTPQSSGKTGPLSERLVTEAAEPLPDGQNVAAVMPLPRLYDQPQPLQEKRLFNRLRKAERCLMAGCRWPTREDRAPGDIEERAR